MYTAYTLVLCLNHFSFHCSHLHRPCLLWALLAFYSFSGAQEGQLQRGMTTWELGNGQWCEKNLPQTTSPMLDPLKFYGGWRLCTGVPRGARLHMACNDGLEYADGLGQQQGVSCSGDGSGCYRGMWGVMARCGRRWCLCDRWPSRA